MKKHILLFGIPLVLVIIWFHQGGPLGWAEEGLPFYSAAKMWALSSSLWMPIETGIFAIDLYPRIFLAGLFVFVTYLHIPEFLFQASLYYILMLAGMYGMYYLTTFFLKEYAYKYTVAVIAALFYLLNPYSMTQVWQRGLYALDFMFALLPLGLLLFAIGLQKRKIKFSLFLALASFLCSTTFGLVADIIVFWSVIFLYIAYWLATHRSKKDILFGCLFFAITFVLWFLVQAWWMIPLLFFKQDIFSYKASSGSNNLSTLYGVSQYFPFSSIIRLVQNFFFFSPGSYGPSYSYPIMEAISYLLPIMLLIGTFFVRRAKQLWFFLLVLIVGIVISLGSNPPFGYFFVALFKHISILQAFRNPYEKYGIVVMFGYTPLFAFGLYTFSTVIKKFFLPKIPVVVWISIILLFTGGIYLWPMWVGMYRSALRVPSAYTTINSWISSHESDSNARIFVVPFLGEGMANDWGYGGLESTIFTLDKTSLSFTLQTMYTFDFFHNLNNYIGQVNEYPLMSLLNAKYLIARHDVLNEDVKQIQDIKTVRTPIENQVSESFCSNLHHADLVTCEIPSSEKNHIAHHYISIVLTTNISAEISMQLQNHGVPIQQWSDPGNIEFVTQPKTSKKFLLLLDTLPSQGGDFSPQLVITSTGFSPDKHPVVNIQAIKLIPFTKNTINEDTKVLSKGKLTLFALNTKQFQQPITTLSVVKEEPSFRDFFIQVGVDRNNLAHTGYVIEGQNINKDIHKFINTKTVSTVQSKELSSTRYFVQINSKKGTILAFNQTINPDWKVVPVNNETELQNTPLNNLRLIRSIFLPESDHIIGNGYANFWLLPKGIKRYGIIFLPQVYADLSIYISLCAMSIILLCSFFIFLKKLNIKRNKKGSNKLIS